jgi:hypothetical protein
MNKTMLFQGIISLALISLLITACKKDEKAPLVIPTSYENNNYTAQTTQEYGLRTNLANFVKEAQKGRTVGQVLDADLLYNLFATQTPRLSQYTTPSFVQKFESSSGWIANIALASGNTYQPGVASQHGGTFGGYLFDENGLELEQLLDKGLFGAMLYRYANELMEKPLTVANVDQLVAIFGAHPDFPNTPTASKATNPDAFMANYAARRDKNDGLGLYTQMKTAFIELQAAVKAGDEYREEQQAAIAKIRLTWEKINFATVINYCHSVIALMSATNPTDAEKGRALHAYGECVGFAHGWLDLPASAKQITNAEIENILFLLNAPANGTPTSSLFVTDAFNQLPKLQQIIDLLKAEYGFSTQEIEDFKKNWVAEQGR